MQAHTETHRVSDELDHRSPSRRLTASLQSLENQTPTASRSSAIRVLVADDDPRARGATVALLSTCPEIRVVGEARSGREAWVRSHELHPDVVLMDALMPDGDGFEATRRIRQQASDVIVLLLTLYPGLESEARASGADGFLLKADPGEDIVEMICRLAVRH